MTDVMVPRYIAKNVIPKKIQKTAKTRAQPLDGVRSPYLMTTRVQEYFTCCDLIDYFK